MCMFTISQYEFIKCSFFVLHRSSKYKYIIYNNKTHYSMKKDNLYVGLI